MKDNALYLMDILNRIERIERALINKDEQYFMEDEILQDAIIRNFEVIGEAIKHLSPHITEQSPHTRWKDFAGFRDVLIHQYDIIRLDIVWQAIQIEIPLLKQAVILLLDSN
jgi:uncharacterized protein with HEPN domain